jgi:hypothetical protein
MIKVESKFKDFGIQIPTDISEITSEALDAILTNVVVAKHYCVVALCQNESLFGVINTIKFNTSLDPLRHYVPTLDSPWRMKWISIILFLNHTTSNFNSSSTSNILLFIQKIFFSYIKSFNCIWKLIS